MLNWGSQKCKFFGNIKESIIDLLFVQTYKSMLINEIPLCDSSSIVKKNYISKGSLQKKKQ